MDQLLQENKTELSGLNIHCYFLSHLHIPVGIISYRACYTILKLIILQPPAMTVHKLCTSLLAAASQFIVDCGQLIVDIQMEISVNTS